MAQVEGHQPASSSRLEIPLVAGEAAVGWLLATTRRHRPGPDGVGRDVRSFRTALAAAGVTASEDDVHGWEDGSLRPTRAVVAGYERALGLPGIQLTSVVDCLRRLADAPEHGEDDPAPEPLTRSRLAALLDLLRARQATPGDHLELARGLAGDGAAAGHLTDDDWAMVADRVVRLLPRCIKHGYTQEAAASMTLAGLAPAREPLVEAVRRYLAEPHVQVVLNPLGLLDKVPTRAAATLVLDLLEHPLNGEVERMGVWLAAQKLRRGDLDEPERDRLDFVVLAAWRRDAARTSVEMAELVSAMPPGLRDTLSYAARLSSGAVAERVISTGWEPGSPRFETRLARSCRLVVDDVAGREAPDDPMLVRLLREAMVHRDFQRRHAASVALAGSPYAAAVGDRTLSELAVPGGNTRLRRRAAVLTRYVVAPQHRMRLLSLTDDDDERVAVPVTQALGHLPLAAGSDQVLRSRLRGRESDRERARLYALGMTASPTLERLASSAAAAPWQRGAAQWWLAMGAAVPR